MAYSFGKNIPYNSVVSNFKSFRWPKLLKKKQLFQKITLFKDFKIIFKNRNTIRNFYPKFPKYVTRDLFSHSFVKLR